MKTGSIMAGLILMGAVPAAASGLYSGTVNGHFSDPVFSGNIVGTDYSLVHYDNNGTAFAITTTLAPNDDTLTWGLSTTGGTPPSSFLHFQGASFSNVAADTDFLLGTIAYSNGTSDLGTLIFGAKLTLDLGSGIDLKTTDISIVTTANTGLGAARDADFIGFSDFPQTFNVYEGGFSIVNVYGRIVGDPTVQLNGIAITEGFEGGGFVGQGVGSVPEPATWALLLVGFGTVGAAARRRRTAVSA